MNHEIRSEQFNEALENGSTSGEFQPLLELAGQLRHLPDPAFKIRLRVEIERKTTMSYTTTLREGFRAVTPYLMVRDGAGLVSFLERAFGAVKVTQAPGAGGGYHAEVRIANSMLMVGGGEGLPEKGTSAVHLFVDDPDAVYAQAMAAGAKSLGAVEDRHYGERSGFVEDPFGNYWYIGKPLGERSIFWGFGGAHPYLHPSSARGLMDFIKMAFGGEEVAFFENEGRVVHAQVRLGDSMVEMGEGPPRDAAIYLYVDDPDAAYRNALAAGATSLWEPTDQPYGERNAGVKDPFGNTWYPAHTIRRM